MAARRIPGSPDSVPVAFWHVTPARHDRIVRSVPRRPLGMCQRQLPPSLPANFWRCTVRRTSMRAPFDSSPSTPFFVLGVVARAAPTLGDSHALRQRPRPAGRGQGREGSREGFTASTPRPTWTTSSACCPIRRCLPRYPSLRMFDATAPTRKLRPGARYPGHGLGSHVDATRGHMARALHRIAVGGRYRLRNAEGWALLRLFSS